MEQPSRKRRATEFDDLPDELFILAPGPTAINTAPPAVIVLDDDDDPMDVDTPLPEEPVGPATATTAGTGSRRIAPTPVSESSTDGPGFAMEVDRDQVTSSETAEFERLRRKENAEGRRERDVARQQLAQQEQRDIIKQIYDHAKNHPFPLPTGTRDLMRAILTLKYLDAMGEHYRARAANPEAILSLKVVDARDNLFRFEKLQSTVIPSEGLLGAGLVSGYLREALQEIRPAVQNTATSGDSGWMVPMPLFIKFDGTREERDAEYQGALLPAEPGDDKLPAPTANMIGAHEFRDLNQYIQASAKLIRLDTAITIYKTFINSPADVWAPVDVGIDSLVEAVRIRGVLRSFVEAGSPPTFKRPLLGTLYAWLRATAPHVPLDDLSICRDMFDVYIELLADDPAEKDPDADIWERATRAIESTTAATGTRRRKPPPEHDEFVLFGAVEVCNAVADLCKIKFYRAPKYRAKRLTDFLTSLKQLREDDYDSALLEFPIFRNAVQSMIESTTWPTETPSAHPRAHASGSASDELTEALGLWAFFQVLYRHPSNLTEPPLFRLQDTQVYFKAMLQTGQLPPEYTAASQMAARVMPDAFRDIEEIVRERQMAELADAGDDSDADEEEEEEKKTAASTVAASPGTSEDPCEAIVHSPVADPDDLATWINAWSIPTIASSFADFLETYILLARDMSVRYDQCLINRALRRLLPVQESTAGRIPPTDDVIAHATFAAKYMPAAQYASVHRLVTEVKLFRSANKEAYVTDAPDANTLAELSTQTLMASPVMKDLINYAFAYWDLMYTHAPDTLKSLVRNPLISLNRIREHVVRNPPKIPTASPWDTLARAMFHVNRFYESVGMSKGTAIAGVSMRNGTLGFTSTRAKTRGPTANAYDAVRESMRSPTPGRIGSLCIVSPSSTTHHSTSSDHIVHDMDTHLPAKYFEFRRTIWDGWERTIQLILVALPTGLRLDMGYLPVALVVHDTDISPLSATRPSRMSPEAKTSSIPSRLQQPLYMSIAAVKWGNYALVKSNSPIDTTGLSATKGFGVYSSSPAPKDKTRKPLRDFVVDLCDAVLQYVKREATPLGVSVDQTALMEPVYYQRASEAAIRESIAGDDGSDDDDDDPDVGILYADEYEDAEQRLFDTTDGNIALEDLERLAYRQYMAQTVPPSSIGM